MRSLNLPGLILASLCTAVVALHESDVGIVDWHQPHAGVPLTSSLATAPSFHARPGRPPTEALLLAATSSNVLAALYASNGSLGMLYVFRLPISI
jgi:ER membrane protein complex subunit 1